MPLFWLAAHVQMNTHVYSLAALSLLFLATTWQGLAVSDAWRRRARPFLGAVIACFAGAVSIPPAMQVYKVWTGWRDSAVLDFPGVRGVRVSRSEHSYYEPIARLVREHTRPDEKIYAGLLRHDAIVINKPILYALTGRSSCCRHSELHPGVADRTSVQREIIRDLEKHDVRLLVLWKFGWHDEILDKFKARSMAALPDGGSTFLDEYIADRFEAIAQYHEFIVMWRKDVPKPAVPEDKREDDKHK